MSLSYCLHFCLEESVPKKISTTTIYRPTKKSKPIFLHKTYLLIYGRYKISRKYHQTINKQDASRSGMPKFFVDRAALHCF